MARQVDRIEDRGDLVTVVYRVHFSHRDASMTVTFHKVSPHLIAGWYVRMP
jgi:hypothetical protein